MSLKSVLALGITLGLIKAVFETIQKKMYNDFTLRLLKENHSEKKKLTLD